MGPLTVGSALISALILGCGPPAVDDDDVGDEASTDDEASESTDEGEPANPTTSSGADESTSDPGEEGTQFIPADDDGGSCFYLSSTCDPYLQDCPEGEKCVVHPDAPCGAKCVLVLGEQGPGEPCVGDPIESTDDCDTTSVCVELDERGHGICRAFCGGTLDAPQCPDGQACIDDGINTAICVPSD